jgi:hypothetical protein
MPLTLQEEENTEGSFFFFLAMQRATKRVPNKEKLLIWLNGGPVSACSSKLMTCMHCNDHVADEIEKGAWTHMIISNVLTTHFVFVTDPDRDAAAW